ncbi:putative metal-dependent phosphoesterases (PHP family) [Enhygromyxa salina]|uniref:Putative metal-dependent phosphoesterases (PHP family) n=1 Tax=Enhygromyxa salina TaxID=215803 RepID=A0A0C2D0L6_9BACT|nr:PHP domain-containing protein [Enhygromyxa salina]KIG13687.1 putative metal-dependent phosphoesterases (PHP family) [Enhygromyxa salina]
MRLELHCHSTCSDGSLDPEQLAQALSEFGVELACLTDHDTMAGCDRLATELANTSTGAPAKVLRGLELSSKHAGRTIHLLIWGVADGPGREQLERRLAIQLQRRRERIVAICGRFAALGIELDAEAILAGASGTPGRPDVARALVNAGVCKTMRAAFEKYLRDNGPADVPIASLELGEALALGRAAGARMSLAHPHTLRHYAVVRELFVEFRDQGLEGIEAFYGQASPARAEPWLRLARELDLVPTAGSDFHGDALADVTRPGIEIPLAYAVRLREWLADAPEIRL